MMMEALINFTCTESEISKIKKLKELRFEQLIEILSERLDPELKIIDFYGLCNKPNLQHFFLAQMLKQGQFVLTTNFDFLIEYALQLSEVPKKDIVLVITPEDFQKNKDPKKLFRKGKKVLYKIHGSTKNIVNGKPTRDSLIATIQAFGSNKEGDNIFQLESFKQPAFKNLTKDRSLVVMGYSGSDDFDIVPTLKVLEQIQDIIWINYIPNDGGQEEIFEITRGEISTDQNIKKIDQILIEIKKKGYTRRVFRVDVDTTRMIKELIPTHIEISPDPFSIDVYEWLSTNIEAPNKFLKLFIPYKIYFDFDRYTEAIPLLEEILKVAENEREKKWISIAYNDLGEIFRVQGNYPEALKRYEEALRIEEKLGNLSGKATRLNNIGGIYYDQGNYPEALRRFEEALRITERLGDLSGKATCLNNIGEIFRIQGKYSEALNRFEEALQIDEELGDLSGKATSLINIGEIFRVQGKYSEALRLFEEALQIDEELGDLSGKATSLSNIGGIYYDQGNYPNALRLFEEALQIDEELGDLSGKATRINNIGSIYYAQGNYPEALKRLEEASRILTEIGLGDSLDASIFKDNIQDIKNKLV